MSESHHEEPLDALAERAVSAYCPADDRGREEVLQIREAAVVARRPDLVVDLDLTLARADIEALRFRDAISRLGSLREYCVVTHFHKGELSAVRYLGNAWGMLGDVLRARALFALGAEMAADLGDADAEGICLSNQAFSWGETDDPGPYADLTLRAITVFRRAGLNQRLAHALTNLAGARARQRRLEEARSHYAESLSMAKRFEMPRVMAFVEGGLGEVDAYAGNVEGGAARIDRATEQLEALGCHYDAMRQRILRAYVLNACQHHEQALETARQARELLPPDTFDYLLRRLLDIESKALAGMGRYEEAYQVLRRQIEAQTEFHTKSGLTDTLYVDERARIQHRQSAARREEASREALEKSHRELAAALVRERSLRESIQMQAITDHLTGLLNRRGFEGRARMLTPKAHERGWDVCVFVVDVDRFKEVNDAHGHSVGDELLLKLTERMRDEFRDSDTFARWGGDEFAALLLRTNGTQAHALAGRLLRAVSSRPFQLSVGCVDTSLSIGIGAWAPGESLDDAFRRADNAMYNAKREGGGCIRFERAPIDAKAV